MNKNLRRIIYAGVGTLLLASNVAYYHDKPIYMVVAGENLRINNLREGLAQVINCNDEGSIRKEIEKTNSDIDSLNRQACLPEWAYAFAL